MALTDSKVKAAKAKDKIYRLTDGNGLTIAIFPNGSKSWQLRYRFNNKENTYSLGLYPIVTLQEARNKRDEIKQTLASGCDPKAKARAEQEHNEQTFAKIARVWCKNQLRWSEYHRERVINSLEQNIIPIIGDIQIEALTTKALLAPIKEVELSGKTELASRLQQRIKAILRYAVQQGLITYNPAQELSGVVIKNKVTHRPAIDIKQVPELLSRISYFKGNRLTQLALQLSLLTFVRSSELRLARWDEIDFDQKVWTIPAEREAIMGVKYSYRGSKMKTAQLVPLSSQALVLIHEIYKYTGQSTFIFSGIKDDNKPMSENTLNKAIRRLGYDTKTELCLHGFRAIACSALVESGVWSRDAIERQMSHQERNHVRAAYIHKAEHIIERTKMVQWWADYLDAIQNEFVMPYQFKTA